MSVYTGCQVRDIRLVFVDSRIMSVYTGRQVRNIRLVFVDSRVVSVHTGCQVRDIRLVFCNIACVIRYLFLERCIQTYGNGRCIIVATYGHGGFTGCAEELDVVIFVFSEVNSFRVGSVGDAEFCGNIGNCRIAVINISYQLSIIHTILDSRAVSLNGKSLICFHIKGDGIIRIVNRFTVLLRAFVRGRFEYPGLHLRFDGLAVVYLIIDLRIQLGFVHAELQTVIVHGCRDVVITRDFNGIFGFHGFCSFCRIAVF